MPPLSLGWYLVSTKDLNRVSTRGAETNFSSLRVRSVCNGVARTAKGMVRIIKKIVREVFRRVRMVASMVKLLNMMLRMVKRIE